MSIKLIILIFICSFSFSALSQYDINAAEKDSTTNRKKDKVINALKKNIYVGSGANLLLGNRLLIYASPQIGYEFLPNFSAGILGSLQYYRDINFRQSGIGSGIFSRYVLLKRVIFETSFNLYKIKQTASGQIIPTEFKSKSWLAGIGYANWLGYKTYAHFLVSYDLLKEPFNPEPTILSLGDFRLYYKFGITIYPFK